MEEKHQPDSMATITMKPEYPPSEVYSASEPPPAYRQRVSSSVQIARIAAVTVVAASFILGAFILASSWVSARASCHQLEQLDAMLDKELALEGRTYGNDALLADEPLPIGNAHALHAAPPSPTSSEAPAPAPTNPEPAQKVDDTLYHAESKIDEDKLQKIDDDKNESANSEESSDSESGEDDDELDVVRPFKLPIHFDLDEIAGAFFANQQKSDLVSLQKVEPNTVVAAENHGTLLTDYLSIENTELLSLENVDPSTSAENHSSQLADHLSQERGRMNCVVEKRRDEPMERRFPFNILGAFAPRSSQAERIAIICHGGDESRPMIPEPQSQVFAFPLTGPVRLPIRPQPERPAPVNEGRMPFPPMGPMGPMQHRNSPFPLPLPWDSSEEMGAPREMRIHVQRVIAIPAPHNMPPPQNMPPPPQNMPSPPQNMPPQNMPPQNMPENMGPFAPPPPPQNNDQNEQAGIMHQFVPQSAPTQEMEQPEGRWQMQKMDGTPVQMTLPWGLTPDELHAIHRSAEEASLQQRRNQQQADNDMQEMKTIVNTLAAAAEAEAEAQAQADSQQAQEEPQPETPADLPQAPRAPRTLLLPQDLPVDNRPHYVQPRSVRSVRSVESPLAEKRVESCSCACK